MSLKKNVYEIRNDFLSYAALREKLLQKAAQLTRKESRLLQEIRQSCGHDVRSIHFMGEPQVRFCFMCGTREAAVDGSFKLVKGPPLRYIPKGMIKEPGCTVGPGVVQKMFAHIVSKTRPRVRKLPDIGTEGLAHSARGR